MSAAVPATANGQPAYGLYLREAGGDRFLPFQLHVLELDADRVSHVVVFFDTDNFARAGLPPELDGDIVRALVAPVVAS